MEQAEKMVQEFLETKTNHNTVSMVKELIRIIHTATFTSEEAELEFRQTCANFEKYCKAHHLSTWGRQQFIEWWNDATVNGIKDTPADDQPPWEEPTQESEPFTEPAKANNYTYIAGLEAENRKLRQENSQLREKLRKVSYTVRGY